MAQFKTFIIVAGAILFFVGFIIKPMFEESLLQDDGILAKPVIYLYPETEMEVNVKLELEGELVVSYPDYRDGWDVIARPDGKLLDLSDNQEHNYLFWESTPGAEKWKMDHGFIVKREDSVQFLREKLRLLGLLPHEYNDFIVYWLPIMLKHPYNHVYFAGEDYEKRARLLVSPEPDSVIRVFMLVKGLDRPVKVKPQMLAPKMRKGFSVIEWGGSEIQH